MGSTFGFSGKVELGGLPVSGARVYLLDGETHSVEYTTTTNEDGFYKFPNLDNNKEYHRVVLYKDPKNNTYGSVIKPFDKPDKQIGSTAADNVTAVT